LAERPVGRKTDQAPGTLGTEVALWRWAGARARPQRFAARAL